ncbi:MAG TPA: hypothetical protein VH741_03740 [Candidatus Limnocylindrales bacterium]
MASINRLLARIASKLDAQWHLKRGGQRMPDLQRCSDAATGDDLSDTLAGQADPLAELTQAPAAPPPRRVDRLAESRR